MGVPAAAYALLPRPASLPLEVIALLAVTTATALPALIINHLRATAPTPTTSLPFLNLASSPPAWHAPGHSLAQTLDHTMGGQAGGAWLPGHGEQTLAAAGLWCWLGMAAALWWMAVPWLASGHWRTQEGKPQQPAASASAPNPNSAMHRGFDEGVSLDDLPDNGSAVPAGPQTLARTAARKAGAPSGVAAGRDGAAESSGTREGRVWMAVGDGQEVLLSPADLARVLPFDTPVRGLMRVARAAEEAGLQPRSTARQRELPGAAIPAPHSGIEPGTSGSDMFGSSRTPGWQQRQPGAPVWQQLADCARANLPGAALLAGLCLRVVLGLLLPASSLPGEAGLPSGPPLPPSSSALHWVGGSGAEPWDGALLRRLAGQACLALCWVAGCCPALLLLFTATSATSRPTTAPASAPSPSGLDLSSSRLEVEGRGEGRGGEGRPAPLLHAFLSRPGLTPDSPDQQQPLGVEQGSVQGQWGQLQSQAAALTKQLAQGLSGLCALLSSVLWPGSRQEGALLATAVLAMAVVVAAGAVGVGLAASTQMKGGAALIAAGVLSDSLASQAAIPSVAEVAGSGASAAAQWTADGCRLQLTSLFLRTSAAMRAAIAVAHSLLNNLSAGLQPELVSIFALRTGLERWGGQQRTVEVGAMAGTMRTAALLTLRMQVLSLACKLVSPTTN
ncbi:hypothetical protein V8C86DRAFT_2572585 [Haematococcus lacustris]